MQQDVSAVDDIYIIMVTYEQIGGRSRSKHACVAKINTVFVMLVHRPYQTILASMHTKYVIHHGQILHQS